MFKTVKEMVGNGNITKKVSAFLVGIMVGTAIFKIVKFITEPVFTIDDAFIEDEDETVSDENDDIDFDEE